MANELSCITCALHEQNVKQQQEKLHALEQETKPSVKQQQEKLLELEEQKGVLLQRSIPQGEAHSRTENIICLLNLFSIFQDDWLVILKIKLPSFIR